MRSEYVSKQLVLYPCTIHSWKVTASQPKHLAQPDVLNPLNAELNPICYLLALLGAHHILNISRIRVNHNTDLQTDCSCISRLHQLSSFTVVSTYKFSIPCVCHLQYNYSL